MVHIHINPGYGTLSPAHQIYVTMSYKHIICLYSAMQMICTYVIQEPAKNKYNIIKKQSHIHNQCRTYEHMS